MDGDGEMGEPAAWVGGGREGIEAMRAWRERQRLAAARAVLWARTFRRAPPWPGREDADRRFRAAAEAWERSLAEPGEGWEPDLTDPGDPGSSPEIGDYPFGPDALTDFDRIALARWLKAGSPMARRAAAWLREALRRGGRP